MDLKLSNLRPAKGSRHRRVRVGRGMGSKLGKTSGRGNKGQKSRRGYQRRRGFEGGQMPLHRRLPKRGFHNLFSEEFAVVSVAALNAFSVGETVSPESLVSRGLLRNRKLGLKILGGGDLKVALTVRAHAFSQAAGEKITQAGGKFEILQ
jgi:large subunit ribosomal protein L15